jgi:HlyD family secretion protein
MSAQASIATETHDDAVVVPLPAVTVRTERELRGEAAARAPEAAQPPGPQKARREPTRKLVFVMEKGVARARPVETGLAGDSEIEIVEGLKEGETVIEGPYKVVSRELADGKPVRQMKPGEGVKLP